MILSGVVAYDLHIFELYDKLSDRKYDKTYTRVCEALEEGRKNSIKGNLRFLFLTQMER